MTCWFFMSYARADDQQRDEHLIRNFYDDLKAEVAARVADQSPPIAYLDQANLLPGDSWPDEIAEGLRNCRTFLAVMTARYFTREYCGKEWSIFDDRCRSLMSPRPTPLIIPVLWVPPEEGRLPEFATDLQVTFDPTIVPDAERRNLEDYARYGLQHVAKRKETTHKNTYETILEQLATRIIRVVNEHRLPPLAGAALPSLKNAVNRFATIQQVATGVSAASGCANFAIVAANLTKMGGVREDPHKYYGPGSEVEWMPYAPDQPESVGLIAQSVATEKRLIANWMPIGPGLVEMLEQAENNNSVAVMIVDPWIVRHSEYRAILRQFDKFQFRNCVVLIPWNKSDPKTHAEFDGLLGELREVLSRSFEGRKETYFRPGIEDHSALRRGISSALSDLEALLAPYRQPARNTGASDHNQPPQLQSVGNAP
jgi:FxsC-like protein